MQQPQAEQGLLIPGGWPQPVCTHEPAGEYKAAGCVFSHLAAVHEAFRSGTVSSDRAGHFGGATLASSGCCPWLLCWFIKGCMGWAEGHVAGAQAQHWLSRCRCQSCWGASAVLWFRVRYLQSCDATMVTAGNLRRSWP